MSLPIPIAIGSHNLKLRYGNETVADALFELQGRIPSGLLGGLKLQLDQALELLRRGDPHAIAYFVKHGIKFERRNVTDQMIFAWLDEHVDPEGRDGSLVELSEPIEKALSAAGLVIREKRTTLPDGTMKVERERPHLATAPGA